MDINSNQWRLSRSEFNPLVEERDVTIAMDGNS